MGHDIGKELEPYRIEWRPHLTTGWVRVCSEDTHDAALETAKNEYRRRQGQVRVITQHVIMVKGLGA